MSKTDRFKRLQENRDSDTVNPQKQDVINKIVGDLTTDQYPDDMNTNTDSTSATVTRNTNTEHTNMSLTSNSETDHALVTTQRNTVTEQSPVTPGVKNPSGTRIPSAIAEFEKRLKKPTIEETHTRGTWLIRNDLLTRLNKLARHQQRGFKTYVVNYALETILDELENRHGR